MKKKTFREDSGDDSEDTGSVGEKEQRRAWTENKGAGRRGRITYVCVWAGSGRNSRPASDRVNWIG